MKINTMKLKFAALLLLISVGAFSQNKIVLTAPRLDTSSLSNRINLKANTSLNNVNGVLSSTYGGAGIINGILKANGSGVVSAATASDIPSLSAYYLPLSGGTLTGALSGTSLYMSGAVNAGSVNASSGGMSAQSFIRSLGAVFQLRNVGNTVTYGGLTTSGYFEGNSSTDVGIYAETGFGINSYINGSATVATRLATDGTFLINTTTTDGTNKLIVNGGVKVLNGGIDVDDATSIIRANNLRFLGTDRKIQVWNNVSAYIDALTITPTGAITAISSVTASSLIKSGGTSSQFLKADGSVDGNTYLTSASITGKLNISDTATMLSNYARLSGANFTGSIGSTRGVFNNSTQSQLEIFGWNNIQGASTNAGEIRFGGTSSVQGRLIYSSAGNSTLYLDNTFDNANAEIKLRTRVAGTAVDALTLTSTAATFPSTMKSAGLIQPISLKTSNYTLTTNDHTVIFNTASGNLTATLPAGVEGQIFVLRKSAYGISTNDLNITPNGSETIEGAASYTISACSGVAVTLQFLSGNWYIINMAFIGNPC